MSGPILIIANQREWKHTVAIAKAILHIGADPRNDIPLDPAYGQGVAARNLQLITLDEAGQHYRLVNLGPSPVEVMGRPLAPLNTVDVTPGGLIKLGEFTLTLAIDDGTAPVIASPASQAASTAKADPSPPAPSRRGSAIGLSLAFPQIDVPLEGWLEGTLTVRNLGAKTAVQLDLAVEGLDRGCYELGPGPILFPGAYKDVSLRIRHPRNPGVPAGRHYFRVKATASAYPNEMAVVKQKIIVAPFYRHQLRLVMD